MTADDPIRAVLYQVEQFRDHHCDCIGDWVCPVHHALGALGAVLDLHPLTPHAPCEIEYGGQGGFWKDGTMRCRERTAIATALGVEK